MSVVHSRPSLIIISLDMDNKQLPVLLYIMLDIKHINGSYGPKMFSSVNLHEQIWTYYCKVNSVKIQLYNVTAT